MSSFVSAVFLLSRCMQHDTKKPAAVVPSFSEYAGSASCQGCHRDIYASHIGTRHHLTSDTATSTTIKGSFEPGQNTFHFRPGLYIAAEKRGDSLYQAVYQDGVTQLARPFNYVVGSGTRGQTFLYWYNNNIFQLPLTYFASTHEWTNSPGYNNRVQFNRPITSRCLECHSTYFKEQSTTGAKAEEYSRTEVITGVECEKCHGPAAEHVTFHQKNPGDKEPRYILNTGKMTRTQQLDLCRLCHGGSLDKLKPSFSYRPGDKLNDYFNLDTTTKAASEMDVHGNQYGLLSASKCFTMSAMTCSSCHSPHTAQSTQNLLYASKCLACHTAPEQKACKLTGTKDAQFLRQNCIDCHMPELPSKSIMVLRQGESVPTSAVMRTHYISIYSDQIKSILEKERSNTINSKNK